MLDRGKLAEAIRAAADEATGLVKAALIIAAAALLLAAAAFAVALRGRAA